MSRKKVNKNKKSGNPGLDKHNDLSDGCSKLIKENPGNAQAYFILAQQRFMHGDLQGAVLELDKVMLLFPKFLKALIYRGVILNYLCEYDKAIKDLSDAILLDPKNSDVYLIRGDVYRALGKLEESIDDFNYVIKTSPKEALAYVGRGDSKTLLNDIEGAKIDYAMAIEINPLVKTICPAIVDGNDQMSEIVKDQFYGSLNDQHIGSLNVQHIGSLNVQQTGSLKNEVVIQESFLATSKVILSLRFKKLKRYYDRIKVMIHSSLYLVIISLVLPVNELLSDSVILALIET